MSRSLTFPSPYDLCLGVVLDGVWFVLDGVWLHDCLVSVLMRVRFQPLACVEGPPELVHLHELEPSFL